jgi:hypothetical protein
MAYEPLAFTHFTYRREPWNPDQFDDAIQRIMPAFQQLLNLDKVIDTLEANRSLMRKYLEALKKIVSIDTFSY